jgi:hypothetical protein
MISVTLYASKERLAAFCVLVWRYGTEKEKKGFFLLGEQFKKDSKAL